MVWHPCGSPQTFGPFVTLSSQLGFRFKMLTILLLHQIAILMVMCILVITPGVVEACSRISFLPGVLLLGWMGMLCVIFFCKVPALPPTRPNGTLTRLGATTWLWVSCPLPRAG